MAQGVGAAIHPPPSGHSLEVFLGHAFVLGAHIRCVEGYGAFLVQPPAPAWEVWSGWLPQRLLAARLHWGLTGLATATFYPERALLLPGQVGWCQETLLDLSRQSLGTGASQTCV